MEDENSEELTVRFDEELEDRAVSADELRLIASYLPEILKDVLTDTYEDGE